MFWIGSLSSRSVPLTGNSPQRFWWESELLTDFPEYPESFQQYECQYRIMCFSNVSFKSFPFSVLRVPPFQVHFGPRHKVDSWGSSQNTLNEVRGSLLHTIYTCQNGWSLRLSSVLQILKITPLSVYPYFVTTMTDIYKSEVSTHFWP